MSPSLKTDLSELLGDYSKKMKGLKKTTVEIN